MSDAVAPTMLYVLEQQVRDRLRHWLKKSDIGLLLSTDTRPATTRAEYLLSLLLIDRDEVDKYLLNVKPAELKAQEYEAQWGNLRRHLRLAIERVSLVVWNNSADYPKLLQAREFLENNEFGLAWDVLYELNKPAIDHTFWKAMADAARCMIKD